MIEVFCEKHSAVIKATAEKVLRRFDINSEEVDAEIDFLPDEEMKNLNLETRGVDAVTDVLSFQSAEFSLPFIKEEYDDINPETGAVILGEIYISENKAEEQAEEYGHSLERELSFLTCHGMLHLLGFDHIDPDDAEEMEALQREILGERRLTGESTDDKNETEEKGGFKFGTVAVLGRPNAGKSTFVNAAVGEKVSIVSWKPQTTRNKILGIYTDKKAQIVFADTPGLHAPKNKLGKFMMRGVTSALEESDAVLYFIDAEKGFKEEDGANIARYAEKLPVVVAVNKVDAVERREVAEILAKLNSLPVKEVVPTSALKGKNVAEVVKVLTELLPEGEKVFDDDEYTTRDMRFTVCEIVREKALRLLDKEIPYGIGVEVNKYEVKQNGVIEIDADVIVEKQNHKAIVLGKGGSMIKKIATYARQDLENITGAKIFITLWVRVRDAWRDSDAILGELGYTKKNDEL